MENKKEYCIYIRQGEGTPYILNTFDDIEKAKFKLYEMTLLEDKRLRPYFVDNDFFDNKYNIQTKLKYFCILERNITEWNKYSEEKINNLCNEKIINMNSYKRQQNGESIGKKKIKGIYY